LDPDSGSTARQLHPPHTVHVHSDEWKRAGPAVGHPSAATVRPKRSRRSTHKHRVRRRHADPRAPLIRPPPHAPGQSRLGSPPSESRTCRHRTAQCSLISPRWAALAGLRSGVSSTAPGAAPAQRSERREGNRSRDPGRCTPSPPRSAPGFCAPLHLIRESHRQSYRSWSRSIAPRRAHATPRPEKRRRLERDPVVRWEGQPEAGLAPDRRRCQARRAPPKTGQRLARRRAVRHSIVPRGSWLRGPGRRLSRTSQPLRCPAGSRVRRTLALRGRRGARLAVRGPRTRRRRGLIPERSRGHQPHGRPVPPVLNPGPRSRAPSMRGCRAERLDLPGPLEP
jgi:hypothetical protein